jgi:hypothetical protein
MEMLLFAIFQKIQKDPGDMQGYRDLLNICRETMKTDIPLAVRYMEIKSTALRSGVVM